MLDFLVPKYIEEGKNNLVVAIGCTGGKHRSVTLAGKLGKSLQDYNVNIIHRDIKRSKS